MLDKIIRYLKNNNRVIENYEINMEELVKKQYNNAIIIDVRSEQEFKEGHINGAINIPIHKINKRITSILKDKDQEVVVYCQIGVRSKKVRERLTKIGYKNVYSLYKGIENY